MYIVYETNMNFSYSSGTWTSGPGRVPEVGEPVGGFLHAPHPDDVPPTQTRQRRRQNRLRPQPKIQPPNSRPWTLDLQPSSLNPKLWTLSTKPWTLSPKP